MVRQKVSSDFIGGCCEASFEGAVYAFIIAIGRLPLAPRLREDAFFVLATASEARRVLRVVDSWIPSQRQNSTRRSRNADIRDHT